MTAKPKKFTFAKTDANVQAALQFNFEYANRSKNLKQTIFCLADFATSLPAGIITAKLLRRLPRCKHVRRFLANLGVANLGNECGQTRAQI